MAVLGVDVGGTFTDAVLLDGGACGPRRCRLRRGRRSRSLAAARAVGAAGVERFTHGTTVATNALLERKGARTAFVATAGFEHLLHLRRQDRAHLYRLCAAHPEPLVPLERCYGVRERIGPDGVLAPLELESLPELGDAEAVAVCLLFSFRDPSHERAVAEELRRRLPGAHVVASHEVAPEFREYERASTTAVDAYLGPVGSRYLAALGGACARGRAARAARDALVRRRRDARRGGSAPGGRRSSRARPAGVVGAPRSRGSPGFENALSFDMGGTSTDVCLIADGRRRRATERDVGGLPMRLPTVDLHTVGAGGGSIVWRDAGGALRVGPESAGADPGPACYGTRRHAADGYRREPPARPAAGRLAGRARARPRGGRARARGTSTRPTVDRGRERRDAARAASRLGRAGSRPARLRARRLRRRRAAARVRARRGARDRGRCSSRRRRASSRRSASSRATSGATASRSYVVPARRGGRAAAPRARPTCATRASRSS